MTGTTTTKTTICRSSKIIEDRILIGTSSTIWPPKFRNKILKYLLYKLIGNEDLFYVPFATTDRYFLTPLTDPPRYSRFKWQLHTVHIQRERERECMMSKTEEELCLPSAHPWRPRSATFEPHHIGVYSAMTITCFSLCHSVEVQRRE